MARRVLLLLLLLQAAPGLVAAPSVVERYGGYWTPLLGLKMAPCEEELSLLGALWKNTIGKLFEMLSGGHGVRKAHCESQEIHCPTGEAAITGLEVRFGREEATDRDLYDFKIRCGPSWRSWLGLKFPQVRRAPMYLRTRASAHSLAHRH